MSELDDIDALAGEYVLGTLDQVERAEVAARRKREPRLDEAIFAWERRLSPLAETLAPVQPSANLYGRIRAQIGLAQNVATLKARERVLRRRANRWRSAFVGMTAMAAALSGVLIWREAIAPPLSTQYVAVLEAEGKGPAFLLTVDTRTNTCVITAIHAPRQPSKSYEVWMIHEELPHPKSLGVLAEGEMNVMPMSRGPESEMMMQASFAVSLEPEGGSPSGVPSGPVLFTGKLIQTTP